MRKWLLMGMLALVMIFGPASLTAEAEEATLTEYPPYPANGQEYWVVFTEGFRGGRIEMTTCDLSSGDAEASIKWNRGLTLQGATVEGKYNQYYLNDEGVWEQIGTYHKFTDYATSVISSNLDIYDSGGNLVLAKTAEYPGGGKVEEPTEEPEKEPTEAEQAYIQEHLDFINSSEYQDRMDEQWAAVISQGLDTDSGKIGEKIYNVLNSTSEILSFQSLSVLENPYDIVIADLILDQADLQITEYELQYESALLDQINALEKLCSFTDGTWDGNEEYKTSLEKLISDPKSMEGTAFYDLCSGLFEELLEQDQIDTILQVYGKAGELLDVYNNYVNVVEWVADCLKYNALVEAYINTSDEFQATLAAAQVIMLQNAAGDDFVSRSDYSIFFKEAREKYAAFLTEDKMADLLFEEYFTNGIKRVGDVFGSAISSSVVSYLSEGLGISSASTPWIFACIESYKTGWKLSEAICDNGTNVECREMIRACYYLEESMAEVVDSSAIVLQSSQKYQGAANFDAAYSILQNLECYVLDTYIEYLDAQQSSFVNSLLHGFKKYNMSEIETAETLKLKWQNTCCHSEETNSKEYSAVSILKICCPTDVFVYDDGGNLELSIEDNKVTRDSRAVTASVVGDLKLLAVADLADYRVEIKATGDGTMTCVADRYDASDYQLESSVIYENVSLVNGNTYTGIFEDTAKLVDEASGEEIDSTGQAGGQEEKVFVSAVRLNSSSVRVKAGESAELKAEILPENAYCPVVSWSSSDESVAVVDAAGKVTGVGAGSTTIQCIAIDGSQVYAEASVTVLQSGEEPASGMPFTDVVQGRDWYYDSVQYAYENGIMTGVNATTFAPGEFLARAQFAVILHRMNGEPAVDYTARFRDVGEGIWYTDAILWAADTDVVTGYSNGNFGPGDNINREQMAVMMYRYAAYKGYDTSVKADFGQYQDAGRVSDFAQEAMQWAVGEQIITGKYNETQLDPQGNASRAECATIMMRFMERYEK